MHIAEGVLSPPILAAGYALTAVGTALGLRRLDYDKLMTVAILAATFFVGSLIHVPIGHSSAHLILNGLLILIVATAILSVNSGYARIPFSIIFSEALSKGVMTICRPSGMFTVAICLIGVGAP